MLKGGMHGPASVSIYILMSINRIINIYTHTHTYKYISRQIHRHACCIHLYTYRSRAAPIFRGHTCRRVGVLRRLFLFFLLLQHSAQ